MLRFEYMRALGHIWYMHPLFVWLSAIVYVIDLTYEFTMSKGVDTPYSFKRFHLVLAMGIIMLCCTLMLGSLVTYYKKDVPYERRNYIQHRQPAIGQDDLLS